MPWNYQVVCLQHKRLVALAQMSRHKFELAETQSVGTALMDDLPAVGRLRIDEFKAASGHEAIPFDI